MCRATSMASRVWLLDEDKSTQTLVASLTSRLGVAIHYCASPDEFLTGLTPHFYGCLITELQLPGMSGLELLRWLRRNERMLPTIVLSDCADVPATVEAMQLGAMTVLEKPCRDLSLLGEVQTALATGEQWFQERRRKLKQKALLASLTDQQREILRMVSVGQPSKIIATQFDISLRTVESRRQEIYRKTGTHSIAELVRLVCDVEQPLRPASHFCNIENHPHDWQNSADLELAGRSTAGV